MAGVKGEGGRGTDHGDDGTGSEEGEEDGGELHFDLDGVRSGCCWSGLCRFEWRICCYCCW